VGKWVRFIEIVLACSSGENSFVGQETKIGFKLGAQVSFSKITWKLLSFHFNLK